MRASLALAPSDAFVLACIVGWQAFVGLVLAAGGEAQILASVVQSVPIDVVDLDTESEFQDESMHVEGAVMAILGDIVQHSVAAAVEAPGAHLSEPWEVGIVDNSNCTATEGDVSHGACPYEVVKRGL